MSKIEVNAVEPQSGTTLTLGASGDTVALAAGALQTGFGRQGTVNWDTTIYSANFTAVSGNGYYCDTSSASFTVTLPASPSTGDIVAIKDWSSTAATNNILIGRNGQKIEGNTSDGAINVHGDAQTLVFSGTARGWMVVNSGLLEGIQAPEFVAATGGTITTCGNCKVHTFTGPGTFTVTSGGNDLGSNSVDYLVVAGGGGGGGGTPCGGGYGGAGAGGFRESKRTGGSWSASPLATSTSLPVTATSYPITVGGGGPGGPGPGGPFIGTSGSNSIFSTITSAGGGYGGSSSSPSGLSGGNGGSGGGPGYGPSPSTPTTAGAGNTPPVSPPQGNPSGTALYQGPLYGGAGGGGATSAGGNGSGSGGGAGGNGATTSISINSTTYAGGGGGGPGGAAGPGGGGVGGPPSGAGTTNRGGGGGGGGVSSGANGGSGIVVIRYKYQ
jgi:hypothetical protein